MTRPVRAVALVELGATVLLALAAVVTAWCSYQATRWNGEQARSAAAASATRFQAVRASDLANTQTEVDVATFTQWVDAYAQDQTELADFYRARFRPEFAPAVEAWIATRPLVNEDAPLTPFRMPEFFLISGLFLDQVLARSWKAYADRRVVHYLVEHFPALVFNQPPDANPYPETPEGA